MATRLSTARRTHRDEEEKTTTLTDIAEATFGLTERVGNLHGPAKITMSADAMGPFTISIANEVGEKLQIGYDATLEEYFIDRSQSGKIDFEKGFGKKHTAPRLSDKPNMDITLVIDDASVELFADGGLSVMTEIFFPTENYPNITLQLPGGQTIKTRNTHRYKVFGNNFEQTDRIIAPIVFLI